MLTRRECVPYDAHIAASWWRSDQRRGDTVKQSHLKQDADIAAIALLFFVAQVVVPFAVAVWQIVTR